MPSLYRRIIIFFLSLLPAAWLVTQVVQNNLGTEPAKTLVHFTGTWAINFLCLTLSVTPLKRLMGWSWLSTHRRMLGLFTLFYASVHAASYPLLVDSWQGVGEELIKRPFITVSIPALLILIVLGITSAKSVMRAMKKNWQPLHNTIYLAAVLIWVHIFWQVRASYFDAVIYGAILGLFLVLRLVWYRQKTATLSKKRQREN